MSKNVTNNPKIVLEWKKPLGNKDKPYAYRWRLDFYWFSFRVHKWLCSDDMRAFHSHPVNMIVFVLIGGYCDWRPKLKDSKLRYAPCIYKIKRDTQHCVELKNNTITWSLLFTWGVPKRWAFWEKITLKKLNRDKYFIEKGQHICE
jgi:hypothetical protein